LSAVQEDAGYPELKEASITNPYNLKQSLTDKSSIINVRAVDLEGHRYNIEVRAQTQKAFPERKNGPTEDETVKVLLNEDHDIRDTHERYRHFVEDDEARAAYEARQKFLHDQANREETAREEGIEVGIEKGLQKGREEGREEGHEKGVREVAARLKASGMDINQISGLTGLTVDEVVEL
jgi:flagellar biosynthesis/type III secretory pathway protein FliH